MFPRLKRREVNRLDQFKNTLQKAAAFFQLLKPSPDMTVSEWASTYRILSQEETSAPGRWTNERTPYLVEIMDSLTDPSVSRIVFLAARQMGKSTLFVNYLGYLIHQNPAPAVIILPTVDLAEKFSTTRLANMFRDTPCLKALLPDDKTRSNKILFKAFPGMFLILTGANSTAGIISMPAPILIFDEIDNYPRDIGRGQGDVISIAEKMQTNFPNKKSIYTSTCTLEGQSRIQAMLETSTFKRWAHPCPNCGKYSQFGLRGEENPSNSKAVWNTRLNFETMKAICPHCNTEHTRREWEAGGGKYIAQNPDANIEGYHVNAFDHPSITWQEIVNEFIEAAHAIKRGDFSLMVSFVNSRLAEVYKEKAEAVDAHFLEARRERYAAGLPDFAVAITAGVDVQHDRLAVGTWAWGEGFENWLLDYQEIYGDPKRPETWKLLDLHLDRTWSYANGNSLKIIRIAVDAGDGNLTPQILFFCKAREKRGVYPIKGVAGDAAPLIRPSKNAKDKQVFLVGVSGIKSDLISWLRIDKPGPGMCHFPMGENGEVVSGCSPDFFAMLTAEKKVIRQNKKGFSHYEWIKQGGARNEAIDVFCYSRAALRIAYPNDSKSLEKMAMREPWAMENAIPKTADTVTARETRAAPVKKKNRSTSPRNERARAQGIII
jgi:phage terminase large subunit GpA-like protein